MADDEILNIRNAGDRLLNSRFYGQCCEFRVKVSRGIDLAGPEPSLNKLHGVSVAEFEGACFDRYAVEAAESLGQSADESGDVLEKDGSRGATSSLESRRAPTHGERAESCAPNQFDQLPLQRSASSLGARPSGSEPLRPDSTIAASCVMRLAPHSTRRSIRPLDTYGRLPNRMSGRLCC